MGVFLGFAGTGARNQSPSINHGNHSSGTRLQISADEINRKCASEFVFYTCINR